MSIDTKNKVNLETSFYGEKTIVVSKSGFGKSYTTRILIEEGVKKGHTFVVIDPQNAYNNLPEFSYINSEDIKSSKGLGLLLSQTNKNVVIRTKRLSIENQNKLLKVMLTELKRNIRKGIQTIVIDEAHKYAPEGEKTESKSVIRSLFQENRSDGLGIIAITQRPARIDKTVISQADNLAIGKVTSFRDKEAVKNYLDNASDVDKISKLEKGEFFLNGFGFNEAVIVKIRKAETEHSGDSPKNLITEDVIMFNENAKHYIKNYKQGSDKMSEETTKPAGSGLIKGNLPSMDSLQSLAMIGVNMGLGSAVSSVVGAYVGSKVKSPIPYVSSRSLGSLATTVSMWILYKKVNQKTAKNILKYGTAGSSAFTLGSLAYDAINASGLPIPNMVNYVLSTATGVSPVSVEKGDSQGVDTDTKFA